MVPGGSIPVLLFTHYSIRYQHNTSWCFMYILKLSFSDVRCNVRLGARGFFGDSWFILSEPKCLLCQEAEGTENAAPLGSQWETPPVSSWRDGFPAKKCACFLLFVWDPALLSSDDQPITQIKWTEFKFWDSNVFVQDVQILSSIRIRCFECGNTDAWEL